METRSLVNILTCHTINAFILLTLLAVSAPADSKGFYIDGGFLYNPDTYGVVSHLMGRAGVGYEVDLSEKWRLDIKIIEHTSDARRTGEQDKIANDSYGVTIRRYF